MSNLTDFYAFNVAIIYNCLLIFRTLSLFRIIFAILLIHTKSTENLF